MSQFHKEISSLLAKSIQNFYPENFDSEIRNLPRHKKGMLLIEKIFQKTMNLLGKNASLLISHKNNYFLNNLDSFEKTYDLLGDQASKDKYIELLAFKAFGFTKIKLSLNNDEFWQTRANIKKLKRDDRLPVKFRSGYLDLYDLADAGYDVKLFFVDNGIFVDFILQQYNYEDIVSVKQGDNVIDAGGCWGDTALYFAAKGAQEVLVYEFIPSNLAIFKKNLSLNQTLAKNITLIDRAVWEISDVVLSFDDRGPASRVGEAEIYPNQTSTLSIDDLVERHGLVSVDFIKMDIEGAELSALKGAAETIKKFRPKLAISVYHRPDDLIHIPEFIHSLYSGYSFYIDYYTIVGDEIILYAVNER